MGDAHAAVTYNGEIYGFEQLRRELARHMPLHSQTDTEVLLLGYQHWGLQGLLQRIDGMFAFALWDYRTQELTLVRDRLGKKPLYFSRAGAQLTFASSLESLLALRSTPSELDRESLSNYFLCGFTPNPNSVLEGVQKLRPGHALTLGRSGTARTSQYWSLPEAADAGPVEPATVGSCLDRAVARRLTADVPVAAFLSGGIDSTLVVASMARHRPRVVTLSATFPGHALDESAAARRVSEHFGTQHHQLAVGDNHLQNFPLFVSQLTEPLSDHAAFPTWQIARLAKDFATVVLTGDGGDELFGGYRSYVATQFAQYLSRVPGGALRAVGGLPLAGLSYLRLKALTDMARRGGQFPVDPLGRKGFRGRLAALGVPRHASIDALRDRIWQDASHPSWLRRAQRVDALTVLPGAFLLKLDSATMAHGLEARSPLLDLELLNLSLRLTDAQLIRGGRTKCVLRDLLRRSVPLRLSERPKRGFSPPTAKWLRGPLGGLCARAFANPGCHRRGAFDVSYALRLLGEHRSGRADHGQRLWSLLVLEIWCRVHLDRDLDPRTPADEVR